MLTLQVGPCFGSSIGVAVVPSYPRYADEITEFRRLLSDEPFERQKALVQRPFSILQWPLTAIVVRVRLFVG